MDVRTVRIAAHNNNLMRYRRILATPLTDHERVYIKKRIEEEKRQVERLEVISGDPALHPPATIATAS